MFLSYNYPLPQHSLRQLKIFKRALDNILGQCKVLLVVAFLGTRIHYTKSNNVSIHFAVKSETKERFHNSFDYKNLL